MSASLLLALAPIVCGWGQIEKLDAYGNSTCVQVETGHVRRIESNTGGPCPGGSYPRLQPNGSTGCTMPSTDQTYYPDRGVCPNGTARLLDQYGNEVCRVP